MLDPQQDEFYRRHMYSNYGEVGVDVQSLLADFQAKNKLFAKVGLQHVAAEKYASHRWHVAVRAIAATRHRQVMRTRQKVLGCKLCSDDPSPLAPGKRPCLPCPLSSHFHTPCHLACRWRAWRT